MSNSQSPAPRFTHIRPDALEPFAVEVGEEERISGDPTIKVWIVHHGADKRTASGIFEVTPGRLSTTIFGDELVSLVTGGLTIHEADGTAHSMSPGDYWFIPDGTTLHYEVTETIRCQFSVIAPDTLPYL